MANCLHTPESIITFDLVNSKSPDEGDPQIWMVMDLSLSSCLGICVVSVKYLAAPFT